MSKYRFVSQLALEAHLSPFHELLTNRNSGTYPDCKKKCGLPTFQNLPAKKKRTLLEIYVQSVA